MGEESYERLADALNALAGGYPRTASGVEIRMLKKVFTPEQVQVGSVMNRKHETPAEIAEKAGFPEDKVQQVLGEMVALNLARQFVEDGVEKYRLGPFVLGWYERHLARIDKEFSEMFEQYLHEGAAERIIGPQPGIMNVVPVRGSVKPELLEPHEDIDAHFERHERFMVIDCICRVQKNFLGSDCPTPVMRCAFVGLPPETPLSEHVLDREHALKLFTELEETGHVHLGFYGFIMGTGANQFMGCCNCCGDCCGVLRGINDFGLAEAPQRSNYRAVVDMDICSACGDCIERCQVHAITEDADGMPQFNRDKCIGCGQCVIACPNDAVEMVSLPEEERFQMPGTFEEWEEVRLRNMGLPV